MPLQLVGTRSCAIRHRTSEKGEHLVRLMGKSLSFDSARARSEKQQEEVSRRAAPDARERILERIPCLLETCYKDAPDSRESAPLPRFLETREEGRGRDCRIPWSFLSP